MKNLFNVSKHALLVLLIWAAMAWVANAQVVKHHSFTTYYNAKTREPDSVAWNLTPAMCSCTPQVRKDAFAQDKQIPGSATPADYANSGYDKGHLFSYDDAMCNATDKVECFLMSNMLPQIHPFNAGDWKVLEMQERIWAKTTTLHIIAGGIGTLGKLKSGENIPAYMYKAILIKGKYTVWIMPNLKTSVHHPYAYWIKTTAELDSKTGLKL
jgi:DNA/RNA endonuclease G (NUC1)